MSGTLPHGFGNMKTVLDQGIKARQGSLWGDFLSGTPGTGENKTKGGPVGKREGNGKQNVVKRTVFN